jgi:stage II sporulation protein M
MKGSDKMNYYRQEWDFFKTRLWRIFVGTAILYVLCACGGYFLLRHQAGTVRALMDVLKSAFKSNGLFAVNPGHIFIMIFLNNLRSCALGGVILGIVPFVFIPVFFVIINGFLLGVVLISADIAGKSISVVLLTLFLPHAIVELPTFFYSACLGIYLTLEINKRLISASAINTPFKKVLNKIGQSYLLVVVPLLLLAAFLESFITPLIGHVKL